jgi:uncharacterized protein with HEPN domain
MLEAIARTSRYVADMDLEGFLADERTVDAVIRNLEVLGEAANGLTADERALEPRLPWVEMRGLRNKVAHEYFGVDASILWQTAIEDLPPLVVPLEELLAKLDAEHPD